MSLRYRPSSLGLIRLTVWEVLFEFECEFQDCLWKQRTHYRLKMRVSVLFLDLHLSIVDGFVSCKIYHKRGDFDFKIVNFPFLDGEFPRAVSYGVYISQLIRFASVSSHVTNFNTRNKLLTDKLLNQGYRYHKLRKDFRSFIDVIPI